MATYDYKCNECGVFEVEQRISDPVLKECPKCLEMGKHNPIERLLSAPAFHLKGGGWYKTDYASKGANSASNGSNSSSPSSSTENISTAKEDKPKDEKAAKEKTEKEKIGKKNLKTISDKGGGGSSGGCGSGCGCH